MLFQPPTYDIETNEVYLKGNLRVKKGEKLFIFGDKAEMHLVHGYYHKDEFIGMNVWPNLEISKSCLIKEADIRAVETKNGNFFVRTKNGYFFEQHITDTEKKNIIEDIYLTNVYNDNNDNDEVVIDAVVHGTKKVTIDYSTF